MSILYKILFSIFFLFLSISTGKGQDYSLFEFKDQAETEWAAKMPADVQRAAISVDEFVLYGLRNGIISEFAFDDLSGKRYNIVVQRIIEQLDGDWSLTGHIENNWKDAFILSFSEGEVLSSFRKVTSHQFLEIRYSQHQAIHYLFEVNPHERVELECEHDHNFIVPEKEDLKNDYQNMEIPESGMGTVIDVMVVYTSSAESWANSNDGGIRNVINNAMAIAQNSADNSQLDLEFRLVHQSRVSYSETGNSSNDLNNLTFGSIPNVHSLRDQYGADLVAMFTLTNDVGGIGWLPTHTSANSAYGYSITRVQQASWTSTHAHEMGHNLGSHHSRNQRNNPAPARGGVFDFSTGWRWTGNDGRSYASVMTYQETSTMVNIFSNPDISHQGASTGSYHGQYAPADNARSIRFMKHVIADFRPSRVDRNPPAVTTQNVTSIGYTEATSGGNVTSDGGSPVAGRGVCWSQNRNPGLSDQCLSSGSGTGNFSVTIRNLEPNTNYYVRAYATNSVGTGFGSQANFQTNEISVDPQLSSLTVTPAIVQANNLNTSAITVIARDYTGQRLQGFKTELIAKSGNLNVSPLSATTNQNGEAVFYVKNSFVERVEYAAVSGGVEINETVIVDFIGIDPVLSTVLSSEQNIQANGQEYAEIEVITRDQFNEPFTNLTIELIPGTGRSTIEPIRNTTNNDGSAIFRVTNNIPESVTFRAEGLGTRISDEITINFIPIAPVALSATNVENRSFTANWELVEGSEYYLLDISENEEFQTMVPGFDSYNVGLSTFYEISGISPGTDYYYRVRAAVLDLIGAYSQTIQLTTYPDTPVAIEASHQNALEFMANWQSAEGARNYRIDVSTDSEFNEYADGYEDANIELLTSHRISGLQPGTEYYYRVISQAGARVSNNSEVISTNTLSISAENSIVEQEQLRVLANGNQANTISIEVKSDDNTPLKDLAVIMLPNENWVDIKHVQSVTDEDGIAYFELLSQQAGKVTIIVEVWNKIIGTVEMEFLPDDGSLALGKNYPNPFDGFTILPVTIPGTMEVQLKVYDLLGRYIHTVISELMDAGYYEIPYNTHSLSSGVYFYRLVSGDKIITQKMVKVM